MPIRMVGVSASVNLPLHHIVQKFSSGTGSPGWSRKKGRKTVVVVVMFCFAVRLVCDRCDCEAINEICSKHYVGHPIRDRNKRLKFEIGDKVCCTKNATMYDFLKPKAKNLPNSKEEFASVRLCNGEIFFIDDVSDA